MNIPNNNFFYMVRHHLFSTKEYLSSGEVQLNESFLSKQNAITIALDTSET
jgi:hypothetical protein